MLIKKLNKTTNNNKKFKVDIKKNENCLIF